MEKFALLNLLKAIDGLSGKKPAGENCATGAGSDGLNGFYGGNSTENGTDGDAGYGGSAADGLGGILGNLLRNGLFGGSAAGQNGGVGATGAADGDGFNVHPHNVMASVIERHEAMLNRVKNKK